MGGVWPWVRGVAMGEGVRDMAYSTIFACPLRAANSRAVAPVVSLRLMSLNSVTLLR